MYLYGNFLIKIINFIDMEEETKKIFLDKLSLHNLSFKFIEEQKNLEFYKLKNKFKRKIFFFFKIFIIMVILIFIIFLLEVMENKTLLITFSITICSLILFYSFNSFQYIKNLEDKIYFFEFNFNYFLEILYNMKNGIIIIKDGEIMFENAEFRKYYENITNEFSYKYGETEFLKWLENNLNTERNKDYSENNNRYTKVNFIKLGNLKTREKVYEVFLSNHYLSLYNIKEYVIFEVTDINKKEIPKENFIFLSNLTAKISHEFITSLIYVNHLIQNLKKKYATESTLLLHNNHYILENFKKIKNLNKFLLILVKELVFFIEYTDEDIKKNSSEKIVENFSKFDFLKTTDRVRKSLNEFISLSQGPLINIIYFIEFTDGRNFQLNSDGIQKFNLFIFYDENLITCFLCNLLCLASKVNNMSSIEISFLIKEEKHNNVENYENNVLPTQDNSSIFLPNDDLKFNITVKCKCNINTIEEIFTQKIILMKSEYIKKQCLDYVYKLITTLSNYMSLNFEIIREVNDISNMFVSKFDIKYLNFIEKKDSKIIVDSEDDKNTKVIPLSDFQFNVQSYKKLIYDKNNKEENLNNLEIDCPLSSESRSIISEKNSKIRLKDNQIINTINFEIRTNRNLFQMHNKKFIMIADDIREIRKSLINNLEHVFKIKYPRGYFNYVECNDGAEIIHEIYKFYTNGLIGCISCLITDQLMNLINGTQVTKLIHTLVEENKIQKFPIIFSTAQNDKLNLMFIKDVIPIKIIKKPVSKNILESVFNEIGIL